MHHTYRPHERTGMSMQASSVHACGDAVSNVGMASEVTLLASLLQWQNMNGVRPLKVIHEALSAVTFENP